MAEWNELLQAIDPSGLDYNDWLSVGLAIKHEGGTAFDWDDWSSRDPRYKQGECGRKWAGFRGSDNPVTIGTLVTLAQRCGWSPTRSTGGGRALDWGDTINAPMESLHFTDADWSQPLEVEAPTDWDPAKEIATYLKTLFESSDHVGYVVESFEHEGRHLPKKGSYSRTSGELLHLLDRYKGDLAMVFGNYNPEVGAWIRFNPLDGNGVRDENVTSYKYALVESDTLSIEKQAGIYAEMELPIATLVHSGGKSLHAVVHIDASTMAEYRERVAFLFKTCKEKGLDLDIQNKNPSRLSRMPGIMRNGQKQYLVATNQGKESWDAWREFVEEANDDLPDFEPLIDVYNNLPPLADPLIDGVLREGHKMLVTGPSKAGKSFMLLELVLAFAEGREWLGWKCSPGRVLYVNLELDRRSCFHRIKDLYEKLGWAPNGIGNIDLWNLRGEAVPMDILAPKLIRRAAKLKYTAIIIDPIYKVITGDENAADKMAFFCNQFDRVCKQLGAAVIYCHHHSKGAQGAKSSRDRASGSGVFARDPDAMLDIIELTATDTMRKAMTDRAIADLVGSMIDNASPGWRDAFPQDDLLIAARVIEKAGEVMGPGSDLSETLAPVYTAFEHATAWRMECTLREFAPIKPRNFWFRHPYHTVEGAEFLADAKAEGEEAPWKADQRERSAEKESGKARLVRAFNEIAFEDGFAKLGDIVEGCGATEKQVKAWLRSTNALILCDDNAVRSREDAAVYELDTAILKAGDEPTVAQVAKAMKVGEKTIRNKLAGRVVGGKTMPPITTKYVIDNGKIIAREVTE